MRVKKIASIFFSALLLFTAGCQNAEIQTGGSSAPEEKAPVNYENEIGKLCENGAVYRGNISVKKIGKGLTYNVCRKKQSRHSTAKVKYLCEKRYRREKSLPVFFLFFFCFGCFFNYFVVHRISSP
jgi:hypothetical protein